MPCKRLVFLPGMGADRRLFAGLGLDGPGTLHAAWIPHRAGEDLAAYAMRHATHHGIGADDILIGVSMGGMVAAAIANARRTGGLVLISTCTDIRQMDPVVATALPILPLLPYGLTRCLPDRLRSRRIRPLLDMFEAHDMAFIRWAFGAIRGWSGVPRPPGAMAIHGSADRLFPLRRQPQADVVIAGGGHFMVLERAVEVADAIRAALVRIDLGAGGKPRFPSAS